MSASIYSKRPMVTQYNIDRYNKYISDWKAGIVSGTTLKGFISGYIERYIWEKFKMSCAICGWNEVNPYSKQIPVEIEHIDGNSLNNKEENLTLICPNHHSLTKTFRNLNKGNGRKNRKTLKEYC